jgi:hypothetical protein
MKRYRLSGTQRVDGHSPGDVFEASYSEEHELYLLQGGHLELVQADPSDDGNADSAGDDPGDTEQRRGRASAISRKEQG